MKRLLVVFSLVAVLIAPAYAAREITQSDLDAADRERIASQDRLIDATTEYEQSIVRLDELQSEVARLSISLTRTEAELAATRESAAALLGEIYQRSELTGIGTFFTTVDIGEAAIKLEYLSRLTSRETAAIGRVEALSVSYAAQGERMADALERQVVTNERLAVLAEQIISELDRANEAYNEIAAAYKEQEYRNWLATSTTTTTTTTTTTAAPAATSTTTVTTTTTTVAINTTTTTHPPEPPPPPPPAGGFACPVDGASSFVDTWGALRSGGRSHQGVDMIAVRGTPLVAIEAGVVKRVSSGSLGGITVWLKAANGDEYYYAHMDGWAPGLSVGQSLSVGELLGYIGNSGNARYTVTHVHFEYHPGGGGAVNPYPLVKGLCG